MLPVSIVFVTGLLKSGIGPLFLPLASLVALLLCGIAMLGLLLQWQFPDLLFISSSQARKTPGFLQLSIILRCIQTIKRSGILFQISTFLTPPGSSLETLMLSPVLKSIRVGLFATTLLNLSFFLPLF